MNFDLDETRISSRDKGAALGRDVCSDPAASAVVAAAARLGLLDPGADVLSVVCAVESAARECASAGLTLALHSGVALALAGDSRFAALYTGERVAAVGLSSDDVPVEENGILHGRSPWVAPITARGIAVVGPRTDGGRAAYAVALDDPSVTIEEVSTAGLRGLVCAHLSLNGTRSGPVGPTLPIMARVRVLIAAAGVGMGVRALHEALAVARAAHVGAAGEQTVQGLLADSATELEAARMMTWKAAAASELSLADASLAKLMATAAAQHAVARATQVVGAESFRSGHVVERLAQDVRALELFAGRTEALRAAVAEEWLPD